MIEVFKTNITDEYSADRVLSTLISRFPETRFTLDLEDCDKVLRAEGLAGPVTDLQALLSELGYQCDILEG